jgi:glutaredoxin
MPAYMNWLRKHGYAFYSARTRPACIDAFFDSTTHPPAGTIHSFAAPPSKGKPMFPLPTLPPRSRLLLLASLLSVMATPASALDPLDAFRHIRSITEPSVEHAPDDIAPSAAPEGTVVLYRTAWCGYCKQAAAHMSQRGVNFIERDIEKDPGARREYDQYRISGVPLIVMGSQTLRGFNAQRFDQMFAQYRESQGQGTAHGAGRPRSAAGERADEPAAAHAPGASFYPGETLVAKIDGVLVQAQPGAKTGAALTRLAAGQAVVFMGEQRAGFCRVVAASGEEGWVQTALLGKP